MDLQSLLALVAICIATSITPGPNNFVVMSLSARLGKRLALPAYLGICIGFPIMVLTVSYLSYYFGKEMLDKINWVKFAGMGFLLFLAYKLFTAKLSTHDKSDSLSRIGFIHMFTFQWLNPKAWAMAASATALAGINHYALPAIVYLIVCFPCVGLWFLAGDYIKRHILGTHKEIIVNRIMATLLAISVLFMI